MIINMKGCYFRIRRTNGLFYMLFMVLHFWCCFNLMVSAVVVVLLNLTAKDQLTFGITVIMLHSRMHNNSSPQSKIYIFA